MLNPKKLISPLLPVCVCGFAYCTLTCIEYKGVCICVCACGEGKALRPKAGDRLVVQ